MNRIPLALTLAAALPLACAHPAKPAKKAQAPLPKPELILAVEKGDAARVKELLGRGAKVGVVHYGRTPLLVAVNRLDAGLVELLLAAGADPNADAVGGACPALCVLAAAARSGAHRDPPLKVRDSELRIMKALLQAKADPNPGPPAEPLLRSFAAGPLRGLLLEAGAKPEPQVSEPATPSAEEPALHRALSRGDLAEVRRLLARGADPNERCGEGTAAGHVDWDKDPGKVLALLVKSGLDLKTDEGAELLGRQAQEARLAAVRALLAAGADPNRASTNPSNARGPVSVLEMALSRTSRPGATIRDRLAIVRALLAAGADPRRGSPFYRAIVNNLEPPFYEALLAAGADPDAPMPQHNLRYTPVQFARTHGYAEVLALMLKAGAKDDGPPLPLPAQPSPLCRAAAAGDPAAIRAALAAGASAREECERSTPLAQAALSGQADAQTLLVEPPRPAEAVLALLKGGADPNPRVGTAPLMEGVLAGDARIVRSLLRAGARVDHKDVLGHTALIVAAMGLDPGIVRLLLAAGADPDARDNDGMTALMHTDVVGVACRPARDTRDGEWPAKAEIVRLLLGAKADPNLADAWGGTPLMSAAWSGREDFARLLLGAGADPGRATQGGTTARDFARHHPGVLALLEKGSR